MLCVPLPEYCIVRSILARCDDEPSVVHSFAIVFETPDQINVSINLVSIYPTPPLHYGLLVERMYVCSQHVRDETLRYDICVGFGIAGQHGNSPYVCVVGSLGTDLYRDWPCRLASVLRSVSTAQDQLDTQGELLVLIVD